MARCLARWIHNAQFLGPLVCYEALVSRSCFIVDILISWFHEPETIDVLAPRCPSLLDDLVSWHTLTLLLAIFLHCYKTWWEIPSSTPGAARPKHQADGTGFRYSWYKYSMNSISYIGMFRQKFHYIRIFRYHFDANNVKFRQLSTRSEFSNLFPVVPTRYSAKITDIISNNRHAIL